ncbi:hypothetical protein K8R03_00750 [Candidatus Kaiserbacteria bacterium]|nr:hypothetical protein [Candidatus Kaiserbacteria bacterium]
MKEFPRVPTRAPEGENSNGTEAVADGLAELAENVRENIRAHVELRLRFANAVSRVKGISFTEALKEYTDFYKRVTGEWPRNWPEETEEARKKWDSFVEPVVSASSQEEVETVFMSAYVRTMRQSTDHTNESFWPFRYDPPTDGVLSLHFGSMAMTPDQQLGQPGVLSKERFEEQRAKLKALFSEVKEKYPDVREVRGGSWLYNREAYRRLFPASYTATHTVRRNGKFQGGGTWGQFRTKDGGVNKESRDTFIQNLTHLNPDALDDAFPLQTWLVQAPIEDFYKEYGIE